MRGFAVAIAAGALWLASCADSVDPLPLAIELEASKVATTAGDSINFLARAQGGQLLGVAIDFGDGKTDIFGTGGARTASITFRHAYSAAGSYRVEATVTDVDAAQKSAAVNVTIQ